MAEDEVEPYPETFISIPWSDTYNPYQIPAWTAAVPAAPAGLPGGGARPLSNPRNHTPHSKARRGGAGGEA